MSLVNAKGLSVAQLTNEVNLVYLRMRSALEKQHADDSDEATQKARESLLCARFVGGLNRVCIAPSEIEGAGSGVFAAEDIQEGEIISCYPGDVLSYALPGQATKPSSNAEWGERRGLIWGTHVPDDLRQRRQTFEDYALNVEGGYGLIGLHSLSDDMSYVSHMMNDGACIGQGPFSNTDPDAYNQRTAERRNAEHTNFGGVHTATIASRPIAKGEEVFVSYGAKYWLSWRRRRNERFGRVLSTFL